jgi:hypothetical protein
VDASGASERSALTIAPAHSGMLTKKTYSQPRKFVTEQVGNRYAELELPEAADTEYRLRELLPDRICE